jgi:hypothetical protein
MFRFRPEPQDQFITGSRGFLGSFLALPPREYTLTATYRLD